MPFRLQVLCQVDRVQNQNVGAEPTCQGFSLHHHRRVLYSQIIEELAPAVVFQQALSFGDYQTIRGTGCRQAFAGHEEEGQKMQVGLVYNQTLSHISRLS